MKTIIVSTVNFNKLVLMMIVFYLFATNVLLAQDKDSTKTKIDSTKTKSDSINSKKLSLDAYPYAFYTPETELAIGEVPFYALPKLGGQYKMRGYLEGRYVDNAYFTLQLEYRQYYWWKFGYVVFGSLGTVAPSPDKYQMSEMKISYGAGLRFLFNENEMVNLRMDLGITREGDTGIYFGIGEAF